MFYVNFIFCTSIVEQTIKIAWNKILAMEWTFLWNIDVVEYVGGYDFQSLGH